MGDTEQQIMETEVALDAGFDWRFSLPFPTHWPVSPGPTLVTYGAALRSSSSPALFEYSTLLCRVVHDPARSLAPTFERLVRTVEPAGLTAPRPISNTDLAVVKGLPLPEQLFFERVNGTQSPEQDAALRTRFDFFEKTHGWMFAMIAPLHPAFVEWLQATR